MKHFRLIAGPQALFGQDVTLDCDVPFDKAYVTVNSTSERVLVDRSWLAEIPANPTRYAVVLDLPGGGDCEFEVPTFQGPVAAARRAILAAASVGWADLPDIRVVRSINMEDATDRFARTQTARKPGGSSSPSLTSG